MSEENAPKLRLKPKLAADPGSSTSQPAQPGTDTPAPESAVAPAATPTGEESKAFRLKPRLSALPVEETVTPAAEPLAGAAPVPPAAEMAEAEKPAVKFSLKPKAAAEPVAAPMVTEMPAPEADLVEPPPLAAAIPAPDFPHEEEAAPAKSFPPPPGKFPLPPGAAKPAAPWAKPSAPSGGSKKKLVLISGTVAALLVLGVAFVAYRKLTAEPPPPPPKPKLAAKPVAPVVVEKPAEPVAAPVVENPPVVTLPKSGAMETPVATAPVEVAPPPPSVIPPAPPASLAFKGWVQNLKVSGVRGGTTTRLFIGGTAYATGDLVNPQLGITFDSYNPETRILTFKDKSGAKVERRN
jgi:hypothetical protein